MFKKSNLLVHTCCAPCSGYVFEKLLSNGYKVTGFFYNPNIYPEAEYKKRLNELLSFAKKMNYKIIVKEETTDKWLNSIKGYEKDKEGGERCGICFLLRLEAAAIYAKNNGYDSFTTVMTISPHKNAAKINEIGKELEIKYDIPFLEADFKKNDGFKKSLKISRDYNLYRQTYCGCVYSIK